MWVTGRKTRSPNAALGFSTFLSCQPRQTKHRNHSLCSSVKSVFTCAFVQPHVCHAWKRLCIKVRWRKLQRKRQKERIRGRQKSIHAHIPRVIDLLFSKRRNHKWQEEGFCLWLLLLQTSKQVPSIAACFLVCSTSGHCKVLKKGQVVVSNGRPFEPLGLRIWHSAVKDIFVKVSKTLKIFYETSMPSSLSDMFSHAVNV